ncbi:MAG: hypothetical protein ABJN65_15720 [Parasphingorhabdus sp.]
MFMLKGEAMLLGDVEKLLRDGLEIDEENKGAFKSRIQHLQRMQFPPGTNTGKGKKFDYGWTQIIQYIVVFDLIDQGLSPEIATSMVAKRSRAIESGAITFARMLSSSENVREMILEQKVANGEGIFLRCVANNLGSLKRSENNGSQFIETLKESVLFMDGNHSPGFLIRRTATFVNFGSRILHAINFIGAKLEVGLDEAIGSFLKWAESNDRENAARL